MTIDFLKFAYHTEEEQRQHRVAYINEMIESGRAKLLVEVGEKWHKKQLTRIAGAICRRKQVKVVLLAGPSSSGKTSTSHRLCLELLAKGKQPVTLSLDNWFVNRGDTPFDENGKPDYESVYALDLKQLESDLNRLIAGEEVELPEFNFLEGMREYKGERLQLTPENILVIEGIHALNPLLTEHIDAACKYKVYIAPMSPISLDGEHWIPTYANRLLRRMCRDVRTRGRSPQETIRIWPSVMAGEVKWIEPFRKEADASIDTSMLYELPAIKVDLERALQTVPAASDEYAVAAELLYFLSFFEPLEAKYIPRTSILREFIGGSQFNVG